MTDGRRVRTDPLNWGLTGLGSFFSLNSLIESQITFDFTLRPDSVQCVVMKGSARHRRRQWRQTRVCAPLISPEQVWKETKVFSNQMEPFLCLRQTKIFECKLRLKLPLPREDQHGSGCAFAVLHNPEMAGCPKASLCWPSQQRRAGGRAESCGPSTCLTRAQKCSDLGKNPNFCLLQRGQWQTDPCWTSFDDLLYLFRAI